MYRQQRLIRVGESVSQVHSMLSPTVVGGGSLWLVFATSTLAPVFYEKAPVWPKAQMGAALNHWLEPVT